MLVRFTVENCLSFRDRVELSMIASEEILDHPEHVIRAGGKNGVPVLKLGVIYGANASGKSNLVKAMLTATSLILHPTGARQRIDRSPFKLDPACRDNPTRFEFEIKLGDRCFAYGFSVSAERVEEEWLFEVGRYVEDRIFERRENHFEWGPLEFSGPDEKAILESMAKLIFPNRLFLGQCREQNVRDNVPAARDIINTLQWFESGLSIALHDLRFQDIPLRVHSDQRFKRKLTEYLRCFDTGIEAIEAEPMEYEPPKNEFAREQIEQQSLYGPVFDWDHHPHRFWARDDQGTLKTWKLVARHRGQRWTGADRDLRHERGIRRNSPAHAAGPGDDRHDDGRRRFRHRRT